MIFLLLAAAAEAACGPAPLVVAEPLGSTPSDSECFFVNFEVAGRAFQRFPDVGLSRGVSLVRGRAELGLRTREDVQVRFAFTEARSGGPDGYIGIAGESWVPVLQVAEVRYDAREAGVAAAAGLVDDPWVMTMQPAWNLRDIAPPLATDQGFFARTDEGAWVGFTSPERHVSVTAALQTGEGASRRERNEGLNLGALAVVRPLAGSEEPDLLSFAVYARQGSRAIETARDHRTAAAVILRSRAVAGAVEGLLGWGLGGDADLLPAGASAWVRTGPSLPAVGWARADLAWANRNVATSRQTALFLGGGPWLPVSGERKSAYIAAGVELRRYEADAAPLAGTETVAGTETFFLQLGGRLAEGIDFER